ncbi:hypothetical protein GCM10020254_29520 [Streptomyces goshikiensis]
MVGADGAEHGGRVLGRRVRHLRGEPPGDGHPALQGAGADGDHPDDDVRVVGAGGEVRDDVLGGRGLTDHQHPADGLRLAAGGGEVAVGELVAGDGDEQGGQQRPEGGQSGVLSSVTTRATARTPMRISQSWRTGSTPRDSPSAREV